MNRGHGSARVTVVDLGSGQNETVRVWWSVGETWELNGDGTWEPISSWSDSGPRFTESEWLRLGHFEYLVGSDTSSLGIEVRDPGPAVATPEPATLALAGLGLAAIGVARVRRRK